MKKNKETKENILEKSLHLMIFLNGIFPLEFFKEYIKSIDENITEEEILDFLDLKRLVIKNGVVVPNNIPQDFYNDLIAEKNKYPYKYLSFEEFDEYEHVINKYISDIAEVLNKSCEEVIEMFYIHTVIVPKNFNELLKYIPIKLKKLEKEKIEDIFYNYAFDFRYWIYNGRTEEEYYWEVYYKNFLLVKKPKTTTLKDCLASLNEESLEKIKDNYDSPKDLVKAILKKFNGEKEFYNSEYIEKVQNEDKNINFEDYVDIEDIKDGFIFVYEENNENKYIIPYEIREKIKEIDLVELKKMEEEWDNFDDPFTPDIVNNFIESYIFMNGVLEKIKLQSLLKEQDFELSIKELDERIEDLDFTILEGKYYSCIPDMKNEELKAFLNIKKMYGKYKKAINYDGQAELYLNMEIEKFGSDLGIDDDVTEELRSNIMFIIKSGFYNKETYEFMLKNFDIKLSKDVKKELAAIINKYKDDIEIWIYNGFTNNEVNKRNTPKIGRNEKCPCGSGKKYKQCCGK